jgi:hypothetical protein
VKIEWQKLRQKKPENLLKRKCASYAKIFKRMFNRFYVATTITFLKGNVGGSKGKKPLSESSVANAGWGVPDNGPCFPGNPEALDENAQGIRHGIPGKVRIFIPRCDLHSQRFN